MAYGEAHCHFLNDFLGFEGSLEGGLRAISPISNYCGQVQFNGVFALIILNLQLVTIGLYPESAAFSQNVEACNP